jgi:hypothetical protein
MGNDPWWLRKYPFAFAEKLEKELNMTCKFTKPFRLEDGCTYQTRGGKQVTAKELPTGLFFVEYEPGFSGKVAPNGEFFLDSMMSNLDLIRKIEPPPAPLECWVNVYPDNLCPFRTEEIAHAAAQTRCLRRAVRMREVVK